MGFMGQRQKNDVANKQTERKHLQVGHYDYSVILLLYYYYIYIIIKHLQVGHYDYSIIILLSYYCYIYIIIKHLQVGHSPIYLCHAVACRSLPLPALCKPRPAAHTARHTNIDCTC